MKSFAVKNDITIKIDRGGVAFTLGARDYKEPQIVCYNISPYDSNCMKSKNPKSGIQEVTTSRTLDLNGGNPSCNQRG